MQLHLERLPDRHGHQKVLPSRRPLCGWQAELPTYNAEFGFTTEPLYSDTCISYPDPVIQIEPILLLVTRTHMEVREFRGCE